eukprot:CAMPEP_0173217060 /NCGR_PEP_ID=MMETSP1142-20121109/279_1 /TAXON_ID=483371 /ORGANISM="non described non described, Strain CCMP2298" /LENGTH=188 /DNA_ID=CAMNT_0014144585 /DNA_START=144 /DNA_END=710 /DNA_ORIENTATION=-
MRRRRSCVASDLACCSATTLRLSSRSALFCALFSWAEAISLSTAICVRVRVLVDIEVFQPSFEEGAPMGACECVCSSARSENESASSSASREGAIAAEANFASASFFPPCIYSDFLLLGEIKFTTLPNRAATLASSSSALKTPSDWRRGPLKPIKMEVYFWRLRRLSLWACSDASVSLSRCASLTAIC